MSAKPGDAQSSYSRKKEEEEQKRARDRAERHSVLQQFEDYFNEEDDDSPDDPYTAPNGGKRHRAPGALTASGPGTLDNEIEVRPLPKKQKTQSGFMKQTSTIYKDESADVDRFGGISALRGESDGEEPLIDSGSKNRSAKQATAKPTVQLQNLPPGISEARIKALLPEPLRVLNVRINAPQPPSAYSDVGDRRSVGAIAILHQDTSGRDIDDAVKSLENTYIGFGHYLKISRGLSSSAMESHLATQSVPLHSALMSQPFGARTVVRDPQPHSLARAPPPSEYGAKVPPPASFDPSLHDAQQRQITTSEVAVIPPTSLNELKAIHRTIENVLSIGPQFEALLMSRPEVQNEEKWAWIWDARSRGGVYYRWRLWSIMTGTRGGHRGSNEDHKLFDKGPTWTDPGKHLPFEFLEDMGDIEIHSDYDSSDEEDSDDEGHIHLKRFNHGVANETKPGADEDVDVGNYLDPMQKAKLLHLLSRLPTTTTKLLYGDVARVMAFAVNHAGSGAAEVVELLVINVLRPFCTRPDFKDDGAGDSEDDDDYNDGDDSDAPPRGLGAGPAPILEDKAPTAVTGSEQSNEDDSSARLIGLYLINDVVSASTNSNERSVWRYRGAFETALAKHNVFGKLGRLDRDYKMGRMTADKWKRSIHNLLDIWQEWSIFGAQAHENFRKAFDNPQLTEEEREAENKKVEEKRITENTRGGFKALSKTSEMTGGKNTRDEEKHDGDSANKLSGDTNLSELQARIRRSKSLKSSEEKAPNAREDSSKTDDRGALKEQRANGDADSVKASIAVPPAGDPGGGATGRRGRARAEDMFADSD